MELGRVRTDRRPSRHRHRGRSCDSGALATVDGVEFDDLPPLLSRPAGDARARSRGARELLAFGEHDFLSVVAVGRARSCASGSTTDRTLTETNAPLPDHPILFPKWDNALAGPFDDVPLPRGVGRRRLGGRARLRVRAAVSPGHAARTCASVVFGFTCADDLSMRDYQNHTVQWGAGKTWDRGTAIGPVVVDIATIGTVDPDLEVEGVAERRDRAGRAAPAT